MKCRYCGDVLKVVGEKLFTATGERCAGNPAGFHVGVTDGMLSRKAACPRCKAEAVPLPPAYYD